MTGAGGAAAAGAAAQAAIAQAIKASGAIVRVAPADFQAILARVESAPLVVTTKSKVFWKVTYKYLTGYKGLTFYAASPTPMAAATACVSM